MESNERDGGGADDPDAHHNRDFEPLPPAPLPAHERTWRHPSELGANTVQVTPAPQPAISRRVTVATVAAGVLLVVGAVRLMSPSASSSTADGVTVLTVGASASEVTARQPTTAVVDAPRSSFTAAATLLASTTLATHVIQTTPTDVVLADLTVGDDPTVYAVVLGDGRFLATTESAIGQVDTIDVHLPTGDTVTASVVRSDGPIVLLDLSGVSAPAAPHGATPDLGEVVRVDAPDGGAAATVGDPDDHGYPQLMSEQPLHDSGPVYDADGALVGICTHGDDERNWLVPVGMLDQMAADQDGDGPVVAPSSTATVESAPVSEPATSTDPPMVTSTTTVTSSTASATQPPKSWTTTSAPKPSVTTTTVVVTSSTLD